MGGGLMQLVAYGAQDIYLTGNPQITFFKVVYRRHTNFSMESIQQTFSGSSGSGGSPVCTISRNGDLVHKMYLVQTTAAGSALTPALAATVISTVELEIGGQRIDRQSSQWMDTWNELSTPESKAIGLKAMTGQIGGAGVADQTGVKDIRIPLQFWFCRNPGLALPLIALQYHEVKVKFTLASGTNNAGFELYCDYIYLDTDERRRFAQVSHEYLIEQVQEQSTSAAANKLNFNHPVKELIWSTVSGSAGTATLKLNGHDRFSTRQAEYFELQQPFDYHTAVPRANLPTAAKLSDNLSSIGNNIIAAATALEAVDCAATSSPAGAADLGTTDKVVVTRTDDGTAAVAGNETADNLAYIFSDDNFPTIAASIVVGRSYLITGSGTAFLPSGVAGQSATMVATCTFSSDGGNGEGGAGVTGITVHAGNVVVKFDRKLVNSSAEGAIQDGDDLTITNIQELTTDSAIFDQSRTSVSTNHIGVYSFALKPEEHQPSGTCNFSRIDNAELTFGTPPSAGSVIYAVNYNVLRIMSGMGGLAYSN